MEPEKGKLHHDDTLPVFLFCFFGSPKMASHQTLITSDYDGGCECFRFLTVPNTLVARLISVNHIQSVRCSFRVAPQAAVV